MFLSGCFGGCLGAGVFAVLRGGGVFVGLRGGVLWQGGVFVDQIRYSWRRGCF